MSTHEASTTTPRPAIPAPSSHVTPPSAPVPSPPADPELRWRHAQRALLAKVIAQLAHEELLSPVAQQDGWHVLTLADPSGGRPVEYRFRADRGAYGSWFVDPGSLRRAGHPAADPLVFIADAVVTLRLRREIAGHLVRDLAATLAADARILATATLTAAELAELDYAALDGYQVGHPWDISDKGRVGFSAGDNLRYAPEARQAVRLPWIAVRDDLARYQAIPGLSARRLYTEELSPAVRVRFGAELIRHSCNPARYWWLPIHPWQWDEMIRPLYGSEIAASRMVYLGEGDDSYLPQQTIRTFSNVTAPHRHQVKLPLSVLDTAVWHGLPPDRTLAAPDTTRWLHDAAAADPFLAEDCAVVLLGEVASVYVGHPVLDRIESVPYQYRELLGAIWHESLPAALRQGERARSLTSLLCFGTDGRPLVAELVSRSGLAPGPWLERLFTALLPPLLRLLYAYGAVFPGENAIVIYDERGLPTRLAIKDIASEVDLADAALPELADLPERVAGLRRRSPDQLCRILHSSLFVGPLCYLARIYERHLGVSGDEYWATARAVMCAYRQRFPEHSDRYRLFDLGTSHIERLCPNRGRLLTGYRDRPMRPRAEAYGVVVPNPLAPCV